MWYHTISYHIISITYHIISISYHIMQSVTSWSQEFPFPGIFQFFDGIGTGIEKIWYRKTSWNRNRKNLVPKKVSEPVSFRFWVSSHTALEHPLRFVAETPVKVDEVLCFTTNDKKKERILIFQRNRSHKYCRHIFIPI